MEKLIKECLEKGLVDRIELSTVAGEYFFEVENLADDFLYEESTIDIKEFFKDLKNCLKEIKGVKDEN